jgi:hypothetical protein
MAKPLVFLMGRSPTFVPVDRRYARNPMWAMDLGHGFRFGLSACAPRLLGLLSPEEYLGHLEAVWPLAQRLLKGQMGGGGEAPRR